MRLVVPELALIVLVGPSGCGKSTFAAKHFLHHEVVSSDRCRGIVSNDENDQSATEDAFELLFAIVRKRLERGLLTVVDATSVSPKSRKTLIKVASEFYLQAHAVVFMVPEQVCQERNKLRPDRQFGAHVVRNQLAELRRGMREINREGFRHVHVLKGQDEIDSVEIERTKLYADLRDEKGPFDIVGDIHGCLDELLELLAKLGYEPQLSEGRYSFTPPEGRKLVFLGDFIDRGPDSMGVVRLVMDAVDQGVALCVPGNHDEKLLRKLRGRDVSMSHGLKETYEQFEAQTDEFQARVQKFLQGLISHYVLDAGRLVVAHAGMKQEMQMRPHMRVRDFALYGETTGEIDEVGLPVRYPWAADYRGKAMVVYGHTPVGEPEWVNHTLNIDTGCVFGGKLTALRYPERDLVSVPAKKAYAETKRNFLELVGQKLSGQHELDELLDLADVSGKRLIETRLRGKTTIQEDNASAALEAMSRFATNPKWLIYLPPTMSPTETSAHELYLEYPSEGFAYFAREGVEKVVCEEKHMGSRAVVVVCKDEKVARRRFGVAEAEIGAIITRTGRRFFDDLTVERGLLEHVAVAMSNSGLWEKLSTDWVVLDAELMPWSAKAQALLRRQYAPVGASAKAATSAAISVLEKSAGLAPDDESLKQMLEQMRAKHEDALKYVDAYRHYCWDVKGLDDLRLAPFHVLASEGKTYLDKDHVWHMETLGELCDAGGPILFRTQYKVVDLHDEASVRDGCAWWEELTSKGGEGMVIKPFDFIARNGADLIQPAVKCRGREYLRIIYGPEYTEEANLSRLRKRGLRTKRSLAMREFILGVEALERFVRKEPLRKVHECVFGVLALESEPVDPRL